MSKILIIGADGQLGFDLMRVFGSRAIGLTHQDIEITDCASVQRALTAHKPDAVINAAAIVKTEWCEQNSDACFLVNATGAGIVAEEAVRIGAISIQISTDYVFDGSRESFSENDATHPINVYGKSKLAGEQAVAKANPQHYIVRSGWFFGKNIPHKGLDFPRLMLQKSKELGEVKAVNDQFGSPTYTKDLAKKIKELLEHKAPFGVYHITNQGFCSWYDFAKKVFEIAGVKANLLPITTSESTSRIDRPQSSILENAKLKNLKISLLRGWEEALADYFQEIS